MKLYRYADEGFENYTHNISEQYRLDGKEMIGCFAFINECVPEALVYNKSYIQDLGRILPSRSEQKLNVVEVPENFKVLARCMSKFHFYYYEDLDYLLLTTMSEYCWKETTISKVYSIFEQFEQKLIKIRQKYNLSFDRMPNRFKKHEFLEVIVDANKINKILSKQQCA